MAFDVETYKSKTAKLDYDDIDFEQFRTQPLDEDSLRCLRYMHDVELHTVCYLRDLLVTSAHKDPEITTFLSFWVFEEFWHGEAIGRVLDIHHEIAGAPRVTALRAKLGWEDRFAPLLHSAASWVFGRDFPAVHMTWGAINEWTTQAAYSRLIARANNPTLTELLKRIMKQEGRHIDFYMTQSKNRLERSDRAQRLTRWALRKLWEPVGAGVMPKNEVAFMSQHLFGGDDGIAVAERIDRRVDRLPGLDGLNLITGSVAKLAA